MIKLLAVSNFYQYLSLIEKHFFLKNIARKRAHARDRQRVSNVLIERPAESNFFLSLQFQSHQIQLIVQIYLIFLLLITSLYLRPTTFNPSLIQSFYLLHIPTLSLATNHSSPPLTIIIFALPHYMPQPSQPHLYQFLLQILSFFLTPNFFISYQRLSFIFPSGYLRSFISATSPSRPCTVITATSPI